MKFFKTKKYIILSHFFGYSFVGIFAIALILPTLLMGDFAKIVRAEGNPQITSFSPASGKVGDTITITGQNLSVVKKVVFNTKEAVTTTNTSTEITAKVPTGATDGKIKIITNSGSGSSIDNFTVLSSGGIDEGDGPGDGQGDINPSAGNGEIKFNGLVPVCNTDVDTVNGGFSNPCDFNMVMSLINNFITFLVITLATPLFALIIIYVGWLYLSDMGNSENITKAKKILKNVLIGYVIALAAWLIVHTIVASLVPETSSILEFFK